MEYALTELGTSLLVPLRAVREWAERHVPDIERVRAEARTGPLDTPSGYSPDHRTIVTQAGK